MTDAPRRALMLAHGRLLADLRPVDTAFGPAYEWTIEDLETASDDMVVARGAASTPEVAWMETCTAAIAIVRRERLQRESPIFAEVEGGLAS